MIYLVIFDFFKVFEVIGKKLLAIWCLTLAFFIRSERFAYQFKRLILTIALRYIATDRMLVLHFCILHK